MRARRALELLVVCLLAVVVVGQALGQPLLLSYVATGSMSPAIDPGDGFVALPTAVTGPPEVGDVVVYRAQAGAHAGDLVTHRVVDRTDHGYVTRGDANPFTDQAAGEPPVPRSRVVAVALAVGGDVVVVPGVGAAMTTVDDAVGALTAAVGLGDSGGGAGLVVFGLGIVLYALSIGTVDRGRSRSRRRSRRGVVTTGQVALAIALLVVLPATAAMVAPAGAHSFEVVSSDTGAGRGDVVVAGDTATRSFEVANHGALPVVAFLSPTSEGVAVGRDRLAVPAGDARTVNVTVSAPPETGYYVRTMRESRYLYVLPMPVLAALHGVHPALPVLVVDLVLAAGVGLLAWAALGRTSIRLRSRSRSRDRR